MKTRSGSFLVICIVLMVLMTILSFAMLHDIRQQLDSSTGNQRYLLAEAAAKSGLDHAVEQILTDYSQTSMSVRGYSPTSATVPAVTYLDGQYRAPFVSINYPNNVTGWVDGNLATEDNDVRMEDYVLRPMGWWWYEVPGWWGNQMYDGRGRYYEPGYYNLTPTPAGSSTVPVTATPFLNLTAALPQRDQAMFYDEQFHRIPPSGNPALDRQNARYRLRYAVGVEDLSGHLLINPMPNMQMLTQTGTPVDYRTPATTYPWMTEATNALASITAVTNSGLFASQLEHVFQGRGYYTNADFDHSSAGISGFPKTYPLMYRYHPEQIIAGGVPTGGLTGTGCWPSWGDGVNAPASLTKNLFFTNTTTGGTSGVRGLAAGGEVLPSSYSSSANFWPYTDGGNPGLLMHCLMGPQLSFENIAYAAHGESAYLGSADGCNDSVWDKFAMTPFGRGLTATGYIPYQTTTNKWYQGRVTTPFYQNLMTTPPKIIDSMLYAYVQPQIKVYQYTSVTYEVLTGYGATTGWPEYAAVRTDPIDGTNPLNEGAGYGRDLQVDTSAPPSFSPWPAPSRADNNPSGAQNPPGATGIGQVIKPDYYAVDVRNRLATYPGPFMNGNASNPGEGGDDLGLYMDQQNLLGMAVNNSYCYGYDIYFPGYFLSYSAGNPTKTVASFNAPTAATAAADAQAWSGDPLPPPTNWGQIPNGTPSDPVPAQDYVVKSPSPNQALHFYSYYFDLIGAFATAIAVFRTEYVQYGNVWYPNPASLFAKGDPQPTSYETLRDLDKLFLAEMGESIDAPGSGTPQQLAAAGNLRAFRPTFQYSGLTITAKVPPFLPTYVPANNILSLVKADLLHNADNSVTSAQRGHVMELMLNDMRMSFLGSSPGYSDVADSTTGMPNPALEFRPLDFDGDGQAYCSCYTTVDKDNLPCAPAGTKPPNYFSLTGNFFIGKSHYYRVFSRGEVWDNLLNHKVDDATLDSVLSVDPEGNDPTQTQFLYQRWFYNRYLGMLPAVKR
jgi:hypothetical protein